MTYSGEQFNWLLNFLWSIGIPIIIALGAYYWWWRKENIYPAKVKHDYPRPPSLDIFPIGFEAEQDVKKGWKEHEIGFLEKAEAHYIRSFKVEPMNLPALMQLAVLHFDKGDLKSGNGYLQDMLDNPRHFSEEKLLWLMVRTLSEHKHDAPAMPFIKRLQEINPSNAEYKTHYQYMQKYVME